MTASMEPLTDEAARRIDAFVFSGGSNGPVIAAMAVLEIDEVKEGLHAAEFLARRRTEHHWVESTGSTWRKCSCEVAGCRGPDLLADP